MDKLQMKIAETENDIAAAQRLRRMLAQDADLPSCHFRPHEAWMNDINGCLFWRGRYHIFYQYNPTGAYWHNISWGHASSLDLLHWVEHPVALVPDAGGPDREGCFSGGAFISKSGQPTLIYHGVPDGTCLASSSDDLLLRWKKNPANPVIAVPRPGSPNYGKYIVFDPCAWRSGEVYYALIGNYDPETSASGEDNPNGEWRDRTSLFTSRDLLSWEYVGPFYQRSDEWTEPGEDCAVPDFFPLGDKYMLLFCSHLRGTQYFLGDFDGRRFTITRHGRMGFQGGQLGGPRTLLDARGRRVFFDWIMEYRGRDQERASGWSGIMTLPRILGIDAKGGLSIEPAPELEAMRLGEAWRLPARTLDADEEVVLEGLSGACLEIIVEIDPLDSAECGIILRRSPGGEEQTLVGVLAPEATLRVDFSRSSLNREIRNLYYRNDQPVKRENRRISEQRAPLELAPGEGVRLRIFADHSVVEVFASGRQCLTQRIYPTREDSLGLALFSKTGRATLKSLTAWHLAPTA